MTPTSCRVPRSSLIPFNHNDVAPLDAGRWKPDAVWIRDVTVGVVTWIHEEDDANGTILVSKVNLKPHTIAMYIRKFINIFILMLNHITSITEYIYQI